MVSEVVVPKKGDGLRVVLLLMRSYLVLLKIIIVLLFRRENEEEGGNYRYFNRTYWKVMTHAYGVTHVHGVVA